MNRGLVWDDRRGAPTVDTVVGRYMIIRESTGSPIYRAFLNGTRTNFSGSLAEVKVAVERFLEDNASVEVALPLTGNQASKVLTLLQSSTDVELVSASDVLKTILKL